jgi:DNA-binding beta-propeller fold protein YncE
MRPWKLCSIVVLALALGALGCGGGGSSSSTIILQIAASAGSVIVNHTDQINSQVTGSTDTVVTWTVTCATGVTAGTCGTIDANGLYTAPPTIPTTTSSGTTTPAPTVTITGTAHADTTKTQTATVTIITGISISISPTTATIGTTEHFDNFVATVNNPGCTTSLTTDPCRKVTWSVPTTTPAGTDGTIDPNSGKYTAPGTAPNPSTVTITATSVADTTVTATATITIVTATPPTVTSVSPKNAALGSLFQDVYITGTNFISTNIVYINNAKLDGSFVSIVSSSLIRVRIAADQLAAPPPSGVLEFSVSQQQPGTTKFCASKPDFTPCQVVVHGVRPAIVGPSPDSIPQGTTGGLNFKVNGGFYGTSALPATPAVNAKYDGVTRPLVVDSTNIARQLSITIGGLGNSSDFGIAGLHQVGIYSNVDPTKFAVTNLAVQPDVSANPPTAVSCPLCNVGTSPSDVAINPATGIAAVVNTGSDDMTLINLKTPTPTVIAASICTGGAPVSGKCPPAGPRSVAVAHLTSPAVKNIALVTNTVAKTVTMIDLDTQTLSAPLSTAPDSPSGVGINAVTGRALVSMQSKNYGMLIDVTTGSPTLVGVVSISTGANSRVAVEPHLNWAVATPGGFGSVGIVDLGRQTTNTITNVSRASGTVTVTIQGGATLVPQPLRGDAVSITGVLDASFDGIYTVSTVGPGNTTFTYTQPSTLPDSTSTSGTASYSSPVATVGLTTGIQGISINPETQTAILVDPLILGGRVYILSLVDHSATSLTLGTVSETGAVAGAFNPLTNTAFVVNPANNSLSVIDPTTPKRLPTPTKTFPTGSSPVAVAVDPASNLMVVVNQAGTPTGTVSIFNLDTTMKTQQVAITETSPKTFVTTSTFPGLPAPSALKLTILGKGFSAGSSPSVARLDGIPLTTTFVSDRELTAVVLPAQLSSPHRFALDVVNSTGPPSNAADFTVIQSIDFSATGGCTSGPLPAGVAIDPEQQGGAGLAVVSLSGCSKVALINLLDGTGSLVGVGTNPLGVAVLPRLGLAIVANNGSNNVSVVDEGGSVKSTVATGAGPMGVAADQDTGEAAVANSGANTVTVLNVSTSGIATISNVQRPIAVAFNYRTHQVAVAASGSNSVGIASGSGGGITSSFNVNLPTSIVYDPVPSDCGASNIDGCFLANSSTQNVVEILDPASQSQTSFRVGINPTAIAYNYLTSTLISTNSLSRTVTVYDFIDRRIRAVLTLPPAPPNSTIALTGALQFAVDIHPLTNLAVIADTANGRVLLVPVPR